MRAPTLTSLATLAAEIERMPTLTWRGEIRSAAGMTLEIDGLQRVLSVGDKCHAETLRGGRVLCETIGFRNGRSLLMAFDTLDGVAEGCAAVTDDTAFTLRPGRGWLGRVVNALGQPIDGQGPLRNGEHPRPLRQAPPAACVRRRVGAKLDTGIRVIDSFVPLCRGQRLGVFAGSGVGKSTLLSMFARHAEADAIVIGLVGERGREVREFIDLSLGEAGLARAVVVVAPADESPLMRMRATELCHTIAAHYRDQGQHVLLLVDSLTRYAMAKREVALALGEPPATRGYPPSVFSVLPELVESAGNGEHPRGSMSAIYTVLAEGDDQQDPVVDTARAILDGHIVLSRALAERGHYPAIDVAQSISRCMALVAGKAQQQAARELKALAARFEQVRELMPLGAYVPGADPLTDRAVALMPRIEAFLHQGVNEAAPLDETLARLQELLA